MFTSDSIEVGETYGITGYPNYRGLVVTVDHQLRRATVHWLDGDRDRGTTGYDLTTAYTFHRNDFVRIGYKKPKQLPQTKSFSLSSIHRS